MPLIGARARLAACLLYVLIGILAAVPRLAGSAAPPLTTDESLWFQRTSRFAAALLEGDAAGTYQTGHPGVTTMWLGALGMGPTRAAANGGERLDFSEGDIRRDFAAARASMALMQAALLALLAALVARLYDRAVATLAGLLLAFEPWPVAHGRLLHLDALLAALVALSVVAALVAWQRRAGAWFLVLGGVAAGLAVLTKSSALVLLPPALGLAALAAVRREPPWGRVAGLALMAVAATITVLVVWPALRANPLEIATRVVQFGEDTGGQPMRAFFLGHPTTNPGLLYYPVVLAFRIGPLLALGIVLWAASTALRRRVVRADAASPLLLGVAALMLLAIGLSPKKQDRYALPAVPPLAIVAAAGLRRLPTLAGRPKAGPMLLGGVGLAQLALCASAHPYELGFYSPLLGGARVARQAILLGWGEGIEPVAAYLNAQRGKPAPSVAATNTVRVPLRAQTRARVVQGAPSRGGEADYSLWYVTDVQGSDPAQVPSGRLVLTVRLNGVDYARLYARR